MIELKGVHEEDIKKIGVCEEKLKAREVELVGQASMIGEQAEEVSQTNYSR